jgi:hypothetical protein
VAAIGGIFAFVPPFFSPVRSLREIPEEEGLTPAEALAASDEGVVAESGQVLPQGPLGQEREELETGRRA